MMWSENRALWWLAATWRSFGGCRRGRQQFRDRLCPMATISTADELIGGGIAVVDAC